MLYVKNAFVHMPDGYAYILGPKLNVQRVNHGLASVWDYDNNRFFADSGWAVVTEDFVSWEELQQAYDAHVANGNGVVVRMPK